MQHFTSKDGFNIFRLPVGWQYLVNYNLGGPLDSAFFATYDALVRACLSTGAYCIIDVHNYARWYGGIIGQGGPTNAQFTSLWTHLATYYASSSKVIMGVMNEPHDLDMPTWATTVQAVVKAIRAAGATSQLILIPGTDYSGASGFVDESAPSMSKVVDFDGTTSKLIYDIHEYYDSNSSGGDTECVTDHVSSSFAPVAAYLRAHGRKALLSETGGGNTASCLKYVCSALTYLNANSDVYMGWIGWGAGSFTSDYELNESPSGSTDTPLVAQCLAGLF